MNTEFEITQSHISVTKVAVKVTGNSDITLWIKINDIEDTFFFIFIKRKLTIQGRQKMRIILLVSYGHR
jgi:hypothetical protein